MNKQIKSLFYFAVTVFSLSLTACDSKNPSMETSETEDFRPEIILAGSTFASPFFNKVLEIYGESHPTTKFTYRSIGSGAGIEQFIEGTADIGTTDAPINDKESARLNGEFEEIIVISGMISIAYNIDGLTDTLHLPRDVYTDIFLGNITRWNDPRISAANPNINLPSSAIQVIARSDSSGTTSHLLITWQPLALPGRPNSVPQNYWTGPEQPWWPKAMKGFHKDWPLPKTVLVTLNLALQNASA